MGFTLSVNENWIFYNCTKITKNETMKAQFNILQTPLYKIFKNKDIILSAPKQNGNFYSKRKQRKSISDGIALKLWFQYVQERCV